MSERRPGVDGIGGIFFHCPDAKATAEWYERHLGVKRDAYGHTTFGWRRLDRDALGHTIFSTFPADSTYFAPSTAPFMVNLRVSDLDATLESLRAAGVELAGEPQSFEYGKFAWCIDCDGRKVELWEPPAHDTGFSVNVPEVEPALIGEWLAAPGSRIAARSAATDRGPIVHTCVLPIAPEAAFAMWTSSEALAQWLLPSSKVELRVGGAYEFTFLTEAPEGSRGGEGNKVLSYLPGRMLSFSWNSPPHHAYTRPRHTHVVVEFAPREGGTELTLTHLGWPSRDEDPHPEWDETLAYFDAAWTRVLEKCVKGASSGE